MDANILILGVVIGLIVGVVVVQILMMSGFLWLASKGLKFPKQDFKTAVKTVMVYCTAILFLTILCFIPSMVTPLLSQSMGSLMLMMPLITLVMVLLSCLIGVILMICLIKRFYSVDWKNAFFAFVIVFLLNMVLSGLFYLLLVIPGVVLWQLGIFNVGNTGSIVSAGFEKIQPLSPSISYRADGSFEASFDNVVGTTIRINKVDLMEELSSRNCNTVFINGQAMTSGQQVTVRAGDAFSVSAKCPVKSDGDTFDESVNIEYSTVVGGVTATHTEEGRIRGAVEQSTSDTNSGIGILNSPPVEPTVTTGFEKMQPMMPTISYKDNGKFDATLVNAVGITIRIDKADLTEEMTSQGCSDVNINGESLESGKGSTVSTGGTIKITAECPAKPEGDSYDVSLDLEYAATLGGITTTHTENGHMQGAVEKS